MLVPRILNTQRNTPPQWVNDGGCHRPMHMPLATAQALLLPEDGGSVHSANIRIVTACVRWASMVGIVNNEEEAAAFGEELLAALCYGLISPHLAWYAAPDHTGEDGARACCMAHLRPGVPWPAHAAHYHMDNAAGVVAAYIRGKHAGTTYYCPCDDPDLASAAAAATAVQANLVGVWAGAGLANIQAAAAYGIAVLPDTFVPPVGYMYPVLAVTPGQDEDETAHVCKLAAMALAAVWRVAGAGGAEIWCSTASDADAVAPHMDTATRQAGFPPMATRITGPTVMPKDNTGSPHIGMFSCLAGGGLPTIPWGWGWYVADPGAPKPAPMPAPTLPAPPPPVRPEGVSYTLHYPGGTCTLPAGQLAQATGQGPPQAMAVLALAQAAMALGANPGLLASWLRGLQLGGDAMLVADFICNNACC